MLSPEYDGLSPVDSLLHVLDHLLLLSHQLIMVNLTDNDICTKYLHGFVLHDALIPTVIGISLYIYSLVPDLHSVDFSLHCSNFSLTNVRVHCLPHLTSYLNLLFP